MAGSGYDNFVIFMHIPKTAGTSLREAVVRSKPKHRLLFHYGAGKKVTTSEYQHLFYSREGREKIYNEFAADGPPGKPLFICGHNRLAIYGRIFPLDRFATFLRHPVARTLSNFGYYRAKTDPNIELLDFLQLRKLHNIQAKFFANQKWQDIGFVGLTEEFGSDLKRFNEFSGMQLKELRENRSGGGQMSIDPEIRKLIEDLNSDDMALYEDVIEHRRRAIA